MTTIRSGLVFCFLAVSVGEPALAQRVPVTVIHELPASVRVAGLAGAGVANIGYAGTIFENPSGLAPIRTLSVETALARPPGGATYAMAAAAVRLGTFNLGGGSQYFRFRSGSPIRDNVLSVGALTWRRGGLAVGGGLKYLSVEDSAGTTDRTVVRDFGVTVALFDVAAMALSWQNYGATALQGEPLAVPGSFHLGLAFNLIDTFTSGRLQALVETTWTEGEPRRTILGLEAGGVVSGMGLIARIGHGAQAPATGYTKTAFGGGILLGAARIDYAYRGSASGGRPTHLFGMRWTR